MGGLSAVSTFSRIINLASDSKFETCSIINLGVNSNNSTNNLDKRNTSLISKKHKNKKHKL